MMVINHGGGLNDDGDDSDVGCVVDGADDADGGGNDDGDDVMVMMTMTAMEAMTM
jgi:hypothetical protein